ASSISPKTRRRMVLHLCSRTRPTHRGTRRRSRVTESPTSRLRPPITRSSGPVKCMHRRLHAMQALHPFKQMGKRPRSRTAPNNSFKPKLLRYTKGMAGKACHAFGSTTQFGLTQALGSMETITKLEGARRHLDE